MALRDLTSQELNEFASSNDPSLIEVEAPNNTVYDEKNDRTLSLPQTLDADETQFVIDRDIDKKETFFAQQPIDGLGLPPLKIPDVPEAPSFVRGAAGFFAQLPAMWGAMKLEKGEGLVTGRESLTRVPASNLMGWDPLQAPETDQEERIRTAVGTALAADGMKLVERNRKYMATSGLEKKDTDGILYDIGQGGSSLLASLGIAYFTRSPSAAAVFFGSMQKSSIYAEAREAGVDPDTASAVALPAGMVEAALEKVGLDHFIKGLGANTAVKRFVKGAVVEGLQEGSQQAAEEGITNAAGIRNESLGQAAENILYNAALGSIIGGPSNAVLGSFVEDEAKSQGFTDEQAKKLREYAEANIDSAKQDMGEFIDKEVAPLAADDAKAAEFMTLMQKFDNRVDVVDPETLTPDQRAVFDEYLEYFNTSVTSPTGREAVEKEFFNRLMAQPAPEKMTEEGWRDLAIGSSKLIGARADAAARALGITPKEWFDSHNLKVEVRRTPEEAKAIYQAKLDEARGIGAGVSAEERAGIEQRLKDAKSATKPVTQKKPILNWIKKQGGVHLGTPLAAELQHLGITPKNAPGLFKKARSKGANMFGPNERTDAGDLDNIPANEFNATFNTQAQEDGNGYVDRNWLLDQIRDEQFGKKLGEEAPTVDDSFLEALDRAGLDYRTATADDVLRVMGTDGDVLAAARAVGEELTPTQTRQVLGILEANPGMDLQDAIDEWQERAAIMGERSTLSQKVGPKKQDLTETENFKRWFGDSKVVDAEGKPLVVYHGTRSAFDAFDLNKSGENGQALGKGFYFTNSKGLAEGYGEVGEFYLSAQNPTFSPTKKTITLGQVKKILSELEKHDEYLLSNYGDIESDGRPAVLGRALEDIYEASKDDADVIAAFINLGGVDRDIVMRSVIDITGKDGFVTGADIAAMGVETNDKVYVVLLPTQIKSTLNTGAFDPADARVLNQDEKGNISFTPDETIIRLFEAADPSTILHELGHLFLRDMRRTAAQSKRPMVKRDYQIIKEWLGVKGNTFTEAQEEKFARGFEAYLREGKAPVEGMQGVFDRFKEWLTNIYKSVRDLDVVINDEVRQVFDRMLGSDFARTEEQIKARDEAKLEADYLKVAAPPPWSLPTDTAKLFRDVSNLGADAFVPVSTRLGNIDVKLKHAVRKFTFRTGLYSHQDRVAVKGFVEKVSDSMTPEDYRIFDLALKNRDTVKGDELIKKYELEKEWEAVRAVLDDLYVQALDVGLNMGYIQDYFPRQVKRDMAHEYMGALRKTPEWSQIQAALEEADPLGNFTDEEKASFANNYLRGFSSNRLNLLKPSFTKQRQIDYVTPEFNRYYDDSMSTLLQYIGGLRHGIESRKLFGKSETETNKNIGKYVLRMVQEGSIDAAQEKELTRILKAVVEPTGTRGVVSWSKNASYIYLMGNVTSAITQIQDLGFSLAFNGYYRTGGAFLKSVVRRPLLRKEDIGIDNILQEFENETRASNAVRKVFKLIGLEHFDNIGKEVYITAAYGRLRAANKKDSKEWQQSLKDIFGPEAAQVKKDLENKVMSENVKYLLFSELSDVQPISLAEMPIGYLRGGNGRVFYMLKTYTVKQIDIYRTKIFSEIASGEPKRMAMGVHNLIKLAVSLMLMGMGSDALKDLMLGRPLELDDLITDNLLKLLTLSKYQIYKAKDEGIANAFWKTLFVPPVAQPLDDVGKDIAKIGFGSKPVKDSETLGRVPFIGKFYYWWWGGGHAKLEKNK